MYSFISSTYSPEESDYLKLSKIWQLGKQNSQRNLGDSIRLCQLTEVFTNPIDKHKHSRTIGQNPREILTISSLQTYTGSFKDVLGKIWLSKFCEMLFIEI